MGWVISRVEDAIKWAICSLFDGIGTPIPNFEIDLPFLDNLQGLVQATKQELDDFLDFFASILDMDGAIDKLIEPVFDIVERVASDVDLDFLNCTQFLPPRNASLIQF